MIKGLLTNVVLVNIICLKKSVNTRKHYSTSISIAKSDRQSFEYPPWEFWKFRNGFEISTLLPSLTLHLKLETTTESECITRNWSLILIKSDAVYRIMSIPPGSSSSQFTYTNTAAATNAAAASSSYFPTPFHLQHSAAAVTTPSPYPAPYVGPTPPPVVYPAAPAAAPVYSLPQYHQVYIYIDYMYLCICIWHGFWLIDLVLVLGCL